MMRAGRGACRRPRPSPASVSPKSRSAGSRDVCGARSLQLHRARKNYSGGPERPRGWCSLSPAIGSARLVLAYEPRVRSDPVG